MWYIDLAARLLSVAPLLAGRDQALLGKGAGQGYHVASERASFSVALYVIVEPDIRHMEVGRPDGAGNLSWQTLGPGDQLFTPFGVLELDDVYGAVGSRATK